MYKVFHLADRYSIWYIVIVISKEPVFIEVATDSRNIFTVIVRATCIEPVFHLADRYSIWHIVIVISKEPVFHFN